MTHRMHRSRRDREEKSYRPEHFGPPHFGPPHGGPGGWGGRGPGPHGRGRGGRRGLRARGDVRAAILLLLDEQPRHGYELIHEIKERSDGAWTPSPGSVYPTLQALEDEGLVTVAPVEGRRTATLTAEGSAYVAENRESLGTPWTPPADGGAGTSLRKEAMALRDAVWQLARVGTPAQQAAASTIVSAARKDLYRLLAQDTD